MRRLSHRSGLPCACSGTRMARCCRFSKRRRRSAQASYSTGGSRRVWSLAKCVNHRAPTVNVLPCTSAMHISHAPRLHLVRSSQVADVAAGTQRPTYGDEGTLGEPRCSSLVSVGDSGRYSRIILPPSNDACERRRDTVADRCAGAANEGAGCDYPIEVLYKVCCVCTATERNLATHALAE